MVKDPNAKKDFFISYTSADRQWAEWIAWKLQEAGYSITIQAWHFDSGGNFVQDMQQAITQCERTLAVLTPRYLKSDFTAVEWQSVLAQDPIGEKGILLPVCVEKCDPKELGLLNARTYIDLTGKPEAEATTILLERVKKAAPPTTAPRFPGTSPQASTPPARFPGLLPPTWSDNIPLRNNNFTGRDALLKQLEDTLAAGNTAALTQAITGLGGVGKTQLATEYIYRYSDKYTCVWWVRSEETATLAADYAALAAKLGLSEKNEQDQRVTIAAVRSWLESHSGWLLLFDNAVKPEDILAYLPHSRTGHILVTSRHSHWDDIARPLPVQVWERSESIAFLLKRTNQTDEQAAHKLAQELGDLPLALAQAAAYITETHKSLADYLPLFQQHRKELLQRGKAFHGYKGTVATTWDLSFQDLERESPLGADLMNLCAFLAPEGIPRDILRQWNKVTDELAFEDAIAALLRYSLVEATSESLSVHRLVQEIARQRLSDADRRISAEAAVRLINNAFPSDSDDVRTWPECARLLPHAQAVSDHAEPLEIAQDTMSRLLNQVGLYLEGRAQFAEAKQALERALAIGEAAYGPDHPWVAIYVNNLGNVLRALGDLSAAKQAFERALKIGEVTYGPNHPNVATVVNNLGRVLQDLGDLPAAKKAFERALAIGEAAYGPDHPQVAIYVNNLGNVLRALGDLSAAKQAFERALKIDEAAYGSDHPDVARDVNNLGRVLQDLGDLPAAKQAIERALTIYRHYLGDEHPNTQTVQRNLQIVEEEIRRET